MYMFCTKMVRDLIKNETSLLIVYHFCSSGGTTVRKQFTNLPDVDYLLVVKPEDYEKGAERIAKRLTPTWNTKIDKFRHSHNHTMFAEFHGFYAPTILEMESHVQNWRHLSKKHNTSFFLFTVLREPTAHSISHFNFFHKKLPEMPQERRLRFTIINRQCQTLASLKRQDPLVCAKLYDKFLQYFDWVGTTENMTNETLPLLHYLLRHKGPPVSTVKNSADDSVSNISAVIRSYYNVAEQTNISFHRDTLSTYTLDYIRNKTCLDRGLWERAQKDYTLELFIEDIPGSNDISFATS